MKIQVLVTPYELAGALAGIVEWAEDIHMAYAWATSKGGQAGHWTSTVDRVRRAVIGIHFAQTEPYVLRDLHRRQVVRVVEDTEGVFHPKVMVATKGGEARVLLGSSNFTSGGFEWNTEANVLLEGGAADPSVIKLVSFIDDLWARALVPDAAWLDAYEELHMARPKPPRAPRLASRQPLLAASQPSSTDVPPFSVISFLDGSGVTHHHEFQAWRQAHPQGCFLNFSTRAKARLHVSDCHHSGDTTWTPDDFQKSLTRSRKLCAQDAQTLLRWATAENVIVVSCDCSRDLVD